VSEALVIPKSAILENEPAAGTTEAAPAFAKGPVLASVDGSVEIAGKARILMARLKSCDVRGLCGWGKRRDQ